MKVKAGKLNPEVVDQSESWWDAHGVEHRIADMEPSYRANVVAFLLRRAARIEASYSWRIERLFGDPRYLSDGVLSAYDEVVRDGEHRAEDPRSWILSTPLVRALLAHNAHASDT